MSAVRIVGFILVALATLGGVLAFVNADGYVPPMGVMWNLQRAQVFELTRQGTRPPLLPHPNPPTMACPVPPAGAPRNEVVAWTACRAMWGREYADYERARVARQAAIAAPTPRETVFVVTLGNAVGVLLAVGLVGIGLMVYGRGAR